MTRDNQAEGEIKRLEAGNRKLRAVNADMLSALEWAATFISDTIAEEGARIDYKDTDALAACRAAIRRAKGEA